MIGLKYKYPVLCKYPILCNCAYLSVCNVKKGWKFILCHDNVFFLAK